MRLTVELSRDRYRPGTLRLQDTAAAFECPCLGLADQAAANGYGNPTRDPLRPYGDIPTGIYAATLGPRLAPIRSYGPHRVIRLDPTGGAALVSKIAGRGGLLIHSGAPGPSGGLRPTHGCIRVSQADHARLVAAFAAEPGIAELTVTEEA